MQNALTVVSSKSFVCSQAPSICIYILKYIYIYIFYRKSISILLPKDLSPPYYSCIDSSSTDSQVTDIEDITFLQMLGKGGVNTSWKITLCGRHSFL